MSLGTKGYRAISSNEALLANEHHQYYNQQDRSPTPFSEFSTYTGASTPSIQDVARPPTNHTTISTSTNNPPLITTSYTRQLCLFGLTVSTIIGIAFIAAGVLDRRTDRLLHKPEIFKELVPLGLNLVVVSCTESLGYIHAKTQQWALWQENRLEFNTNIRLFTYARRSWANGAVLNTVSLVSLALSYTATGAILLSADTVADDEAAGGSSSGNGGGRLVELSFSQAGPICLGVSLLVQVLICIMGLRTTRIRTWSSHPLLNAAVVREQSRGGSDGGLRLHNVAQYYRALGVSTSSSRQPSAFRFHRSVRTMLWVLTLTLVVLIIWMAVVLARALKTGSGSSWAILPHRGSGSAADSPWLVLGFFGRISSREMRVLAQIALTVVIQLFVTVGLHISELAVLLSRDEDAWRAAGTSSGANLRTSSFLMVLKSWKSLALLLFKPVIHWMYGLAMYITYDGLVMMAPQLVYLIALWVLLIAFVLFLSFKTPKGEQPATYGHLPTLVELIQDWNLDAKGRLYWGQKTEQQGGFEFENEIHGDEHMYEHERQPGSQRWSIVKALFGGSDSSSAKQGKHGSGRPQVLRNRPVSTSTF